MKKIIIALVAVLVLVGCSSKGEVKLTLLDGDLEWDKPVDIKVDLNGVKVKYDAWLGVIPKEVPRGVGEGLANNARVAFVYLYTGVDDVVKLYLPEEEGNYDLRLYSGPNGKEVFAIDLRDLFSQVAPLDDVVLTEDDLLDGTFNLGQNTNSSSDEDKIGDLTPAQCLDGNWRFANMSQYLESVFADVGSLGGPVSVTDSGDLILSFDSGKMSMRDNNLKVNVTFMGMNVPVNIDASGTNTYTVEGNILKGGLADVDARDSLSNVGISIRSFASTDVEFDCQGDRLVWMKNSFIPIDLILDRL